MVIFLTVVHILVCLMLIALVLLQDPKSGGAGGMFGGGGGGSNSLFGATGAVTFLTRLTRYSAIVFGVTCLLLTVLSRSNTGSVIDQLPASAPAIPFEPNANSNPATGNNPAPQPAPNNNVPSEPATAPAPPPANTK